MLKQENQVLIGKLSLFIYRFKQINDSQRSNELKYEELNNLVESLKNELDIPKLSKKDINTLQNLGFL